jgi:UDP-2,3-diacylglucosamine hydrolase
MTTLFISDLHLCATRPAATDAFLKFLRNDATEADALYILGDLFESWIGDDDPDETYRVVKRGLRELTEKNIPCFVMHGNRDFLLGRRFAAETGTQLIDDPITIELYDQRVVLTHGDIMCTDDHAYQRFRKIAHQPLVKSLFLALPLTWRNRLASRIRARSQSSTAAKPVYIIDVNEQAVQKMLLTHNTRLLLHGHTHRPAIHNINTSAVPATRIVLGDWYEQGSVLLWSAEGFELTRLEF